MPNLDTVSDLQTEKICYVLCGFCNTMLLVNVPCSSLSKLVTVKCGHCNIILSVNMIKPSLLPFQFLTPIHHHHQQNKVLQLKWGACCEEVDADEKTVNRCCPSLCFSSTEAEDSIQVHQIIHKPALKKQRAPSAYNCFIKEEIKRLKTEHPNLSHKQAFTAASKNWAHFPQKYSI